MLIEVDRIMISVLGEMEGERRGEEKREGWRRDDKKNTCDEVYLFID